jgi:hypothetical protein
MKQKFNLLDPHWIEVVIIVVTLTFLMCGCKSVQYVPVVQTNTEHHWHTDSVIKNDSTIKEINTVVMQLDSAAMAQYGIQLKQAERAWLVKTKELERQIEKLMQMSATKDTVHDSIPVPYEVVREVPAKMSKTQKGFMWFGIIAMMALVLIVGRWASKHIPRI